MQLQGFTRKKRTNFVSLSLSLFLMTPATFNPSFNSTNSFAVSSSTTPIYGPYCKRINNRNRDSKKGRQRTNRISKRICKKEHIPCRASYMFNVLNCLLFLTFSTGAMFYHMFDISSLYFAYSVVTSIGLQAPKIIQIPSTVLCIYYPNFLNWTLLVPKMGSVHSKVLRGSEIDLYHTENILSLKDIFQMTPEFDDFASTSNCYHRQSGIYLMRRSPCKSILKATKYLYGHNICYLMSLRSSGNFTPSYPPATLTLHELKSHAFYLDLIYELILDDSYFKNVTTIDATLYADEKIPKTTNSFSIIFNRDRAFTINDLPYSFNFYFIGYSMVNSTQLPFPYTNCHLSQEFRFSFDECVDKCLLKLVRSELNRIPMTAIVRNSSFNEKLVTTNDLKNFSFQEHLTFLEKRCLSQCPGRDCRETIYLTKLLRTEMSNDIRFRINALNEPMIHVEKKPKTSISEYVVHILNCLGIWCGLSVWDLRSLVLKPYFFVVSLKSKGQPAKSHLPHIEYNRTARREKEKD